MLNPVEIYNIVVLNLWSNRHILKQEQEFKTSIFNFRQAGWYFSLKTQSGKRIRPQAAAILLPLLFNQRQ